jgi:hypothetical protein
MDLDLHSSYTRSWHGAHAKVKPHPKIHMFTLWWGKTVIKYPCQKKVMSIIMGAQKRNLFKIFHLLPVAIEYLVFLITFTHLSIIKNENMANMSAFKTKHFQYKWIQIYILVTVHVLWVTHPKEYYQSSQLNTT